MNEPHLKIVISLWAGLGDVIFATPVFKVLRKKFPDSHISALVWSHGAKELLRHNPYIDEFVEGSFIKIRSLISKLKDYDIGVQCSHPVQFIFILAGIKKRTSFNGNPFWWLYPVDSNDSHSTEYFLSAVDKIDGIKLRDDDSWEIFLEEEELLAAKSLLKKFNNTSPLIAIHPGGRNNKCKRWKTQKFALLCNLLKQKFDAKILLIGSNKDIKLCNFIENHIHSNLQPATCNLQPATCLNLAGKLSLRQSAAVIKHCDLFIGNASGPTYIASALGIPVVGIFGPDNPKNFGPLGKNIRVVTPKLLCAPCLNFYRHFFWGMRLRYIPICLAMQSIKTEEVFAACSHLLTPNPLNP